MIGTSSPGGVAAVLDVYRQCGLFDRWPILYMATHTDINAHNVRKVITAGKCLFRYFVMLLRGNVSILHAHTSSRGSFWRKCLFIFPTFLFRRPVVFHLHSGEFMHFYRNGCGPIGKYIVRYVLDHSASIIVLSEYWKQRISEITRNPAVVPILNPILVDDTVSEASPRESCTLLFLGRLVERKGIYVLLEAVAQLVTEFPNLKLLCAGDGDLQSVADASVKLDIPGRVRFLGWVSGRQKQQLLESASVFVLPSFAEGLPMSVLEAMAAGLPVVATTVGGIPDLIGDGKEGILVPPRDTNSLRKALEFLLRDEKIRAEMGRKGYERYRTEFSAELVVPKIEAIYKELGASTLT